MAHVYQSILSPKVQRTSWQRVWKTKSQKLGRCSESSGHDTAILETYTRLALGQTWQNSNTEGRGHQAPPLAEEPWAADSFYGKESFSFGYSWWGLPMLQRMVSSQANIDYLKEGLEKRLTEAKSTNCSFRWEYSSQPWHHTVTTACNSGHQTPLRAPALHPCTNSPRDTHIHTELKINLRNNKKGRTAYEDGWEEFCWGKVWG